MLESFNTKNSFEYQKLTEEEQTKRGILGRLVGPIADSVNPTRNGRRYSGELWEKVFKNPIMQEKIENRVCFGELGHPADRTENAAGHMETRGIPIGIIVLFYSSPLICVTHLSSAFSILDDAFSYSETMPWDAFSHTVLNVMTKSPKLKYSPKSYTRFPRMISSISADASSREPFVFNATS